MMFRALLLALSSVSVCGFAGLTQLVSSGALQPEAAFAALDHAQLHLASAAAAVNPAADLLEAYTHTLKAHPLVTKMLTGGVLATCGDAIAQSMNDEDTYDRRRALSFGTFDMAYRALQHVAFPIIVQQCQGQYASGLLGSLGVLNAFDGHTDLLAAMEQTLASQLGIVPFLYYPVFFALTGFVQGLTSDQAIQRAQETFLPLMKRNLLFWIPVQFVQFGFVPTDLQIPFLSICGLCWTFILSAYAGSAKGYAAAAEEDDAVVIGNVIDEDLQVVMADSTIVFEESEGRTIKAGVKQEDKELVSR
mmetsp:Transcript_7758/g.12842  ORF Transcript_7758/g.12842 Transcript_7758/m.12842 type:complete len:305 (+) Transcript_7758:150-1064(+)